MPNFFRTAVFFNIFSQNRKKFLKRTIIIGGGLAGLVTAIELAGAGISCVVIEKKSYPFHRVCGEYLSNEVINYLRSKSLLPAYYLPSISRFLLSDIHGHSKEMNLDLGGIGISRYSFDHFLFQRAREAGVTFYQNEEVTDIQFVGNAFTVKTNNREIPCDVAVGAFGKRSKLDYQLHRGFTGKRSPYVGIKYHVRIDHPDNLIALHNFPGGYCGMSNIEDGKTTLCYLTHRDNLKKYKNVREMEEAILFCNPHLSRIFRSAEFLFDKPEVINEITFATKAPIESHVLMTGDSAGMIAPLCGNGMAMAIQSGRLLSKEIVGFCNGHATRSEMETHYANTWNSHFKQRLWMGRQVQRLFGNELTSRMAVSLVMNIQPLATAIVRNTHGQPF